MSEELRRICPTFLNLSEINRSNISKYRELYDVMRCHSRNNAYLVQYFKQPSVTHCNCPACRLGLWSPFTLDTELAGSLPHAWQVVVPTMLLQMLLILLRFLFLVLLFDCSAIRTFYIESHLNQSCILCLKGTSSHNTTC